MTGFLCKDTHRPHGATAIHTAADITAIDVDLGIASGDTSEGVVFSYSNLLMSYRILGLGIGSRIIKGNSLIFVGTATGAIHIATIGEYICLLPRGHAFVFRKSAADGATIHINHRFKVSVSVFARAIHRAVDFREIVRRRAFSTDVHLGIGSVGQRVHESAGSVNHAPARAKHHAVLIAIGAYGAAGDGD